MLAVALHLRWQDLSPRDIAARLVIAAGKKKGQQPPQASPTATSNGGTPVPKPAHSADYARLQVGTIKRETANRLSTLVRYIGPRIASYESGMST
jgi:hypothetical protein